MTDVSVRRDPSKFTSLNDFLEKEGVLDQTATYAQDHVTVLGFLRQLIDIKVKSHGNEWDQEALKLLRTDIRAYIADIRTPTSMTNMNGLAAKTFIYQFMSRGYSSAKGWNIMALEQIVSDVTMYLESKDV